MTANAQSEGHSGMSEMKRRHARQRLVSMVAGPLWVGLSVLVMRFWYRYRIADVDGVRAQYRAIRGQSDAPMLMRQSFDVGRFVSRGLGVGLWRVLGDTSRRTRVEYAGVDEFWSDA
jgi:hypothetical protein